jgi:uncharacterized membrane protein YdjX (TVP38/TMEM64 family)
VKAFWIILAATAGLIAAFFVFRGDYDRAFIAAAAGAVCWFLNYRRQLRENITRHDEEKNEDEEFDEEERS